ncbi:amidohydrolase family protein [Gemmatimonadota bacterium]
MFSPSVRVVSGLTTVILALLLLFQGAPAQDRGTATLAILGGYLIDGNEGPPVSNAVSLVEGSRFIYESTWQEMDLLVQYGMPAMKFISGATRLPPELFGLGQELGTIEPGKLADIIVVDGNSLQDMNALKHAVHVSKDGRVIR